METQQPVLEQPQVVVEKPSWDDVWKYAEAQVRHYLGTKAKLLPEEQHEEIQQEAYIRVLDAYDRLDPTRGWKSFVQLHCMGTVMDYIRAGAGFEESGVEVDEEGEACLKSRLSLNDPESGEDVDLGQVLGMNGVSTDNADDEIKKLFVDPNWDLVARLASRDVLSHIVAKWVIGFTQTEEAENFEVSRERLSQRIREFFKKLDSPANLNSAVTNQTIYAFGLSKFYGMKERDNGVGRDWDAVDLNSSTSFRDIEELLRPTMVKTGKQKNSIEGEREAMPKIEIPESGIVPVTFEQQALI